VERQIELFSDLVEEESWKEEHNEANMAAELGEVLVFGNETYDAMVRFDESARLLALKGEGPVEHVQEVKKLFGEWLALGRRVVVSIEFFEGRGHDLDQAAEFRKRLAECEWALKPASQAMNHPKMVAARDAAVAEFRSGFRKKKSSRRTSARI